VKRTSFTTATAASAQDLPEGRAESCADLRGSIIEPVIDLRHILRERPDRRDDVRELLDRRNDLRAFCQAESREETI